MPLGWSSRGLHYITTYGWVLKDEDQMEVHSEQTKSGNVASIKRKTMGAYAADIQKVDSNNPNPNTEPCPSFWSDKNSQW